MSNAQRDCPPASEAGKVRAGARVKASLPAASPVPVRPETLRSKRAAGARRKKQAPPSAIASLVVPLLPHEAALAVQTWPEPLVDRTAEPEREIPYANPPPVNLKKRKSRNPLAPPRKPSSTKPSSKRSPAPRHPARARKPRLAPELDPAPLPPLAAIVIRPAVFYRAEPGPKPWIILGAMLRRTLARLARIRIRPSAERRSLAQASRRYRQLLDEAEALVPLIPPSA